MSTCDFTLLYFKIATQHFIISLDHDLTVDGHLGCFQSLAVLQCGWVIAHIGIHLCKIYFYKWKYWVKNFVFESWMDSAKLFCTVAVALY